MLFNSLDFAIFLPIVFLIYWIACKNRYYQNTFLLLASYFFYGWWDWRFLFLIAASSFLDFTLGQRIFSSSDRKEKKRFLIISIVFNLGMLCFFKYLNFFIDSFVDSFNLMGASFSRRNLNIILPVGISFYTFQTLSYTIDIYKGKLNPARNMTSFFAFVSFFPQLVAGPIERASNLLPQFDNKKEFSFKECSNGLTQMLWGLFKKVVIADSCAYHVNKIFTGYESIDSFFLIIGAILFVFQVYADFSGYSDIAIGTARLFGFRLMTNFKTPYFSTSWGEFWKRWHISLSSWILDYVYNPLVLSIRDWQAKGIVFALVLTFILNGLWHGANWTFIVFGFLLGLFISTEFILRFQRKNLSKRIGKRNMSILGWFVVMITWTLACILFRAESLTHAINYMRLIVDPSNWIIQRYKGLQYLLQVFFFISMMLCIDWKGKNFDYSLFFIRNYKNSFLRWSCYIFLCCMIGLYMETNDQPFIYFQF